MDYLGINYYTTTRVAFDKNVPLLHGHAVPFGPSAYSDMWEFYPKGLAETIERINKVYTRLPLYILENGTSLDEKENDQGRIHYLAAHLEEVSKCLENGIPIKGYFAWSLLDNFEWGHGYSKRFGLVYVDFETLKRQPKASARWYSKLIQNGKIKP